MQRNSNKRMYSVLRYDANRIRPASKSYVLIVSNIHQHNHQTVARVHFYVGPDSKLIPKEQMQCIHICYTERVDFSSLEAAVGSIFVDVL